jgi:hypothetical protein
LGAFTQVQFSADYTISMPGFDLRQGQVSIGDMVKHQLAECQYEHKAMREYIATG